MSANEKYKVSKNQAKRQNNFLQTNFSRVAISLYKN
jgi:hypothetical protein